MVIETHWLKECYYDAPSRSGALVGPELKTGQKKTSPDCFSSSCTVGDRGCSGAGDRRAGGAGTSRPEPDLTERFRGRREREPSRLRDGARWLIRVDEVAVHFR